MIRKREQNTLIKNILKPFFEERTLWGKKWKKIDQVFIKINELIRTTIFIRIYHRNGNSHHGFLARSSSYQSMMNSIR